MLFCLPVEILLHVGRYLPREDLIPFTTTCKGIRKVFMVQVFGGTVQFRSPLPDFPNIFDVFNFLHLRMPGLQNRVDQVRFYQQRSDLAKSVHTVQITNWTTPSPQCFLSTASDLAEDVPECQLLLKKFQSDQYYANALTQFCSVYNSILVNLLQCLPFSELQFIRTHITLITHRMLHMMPMLRRLAFEDCIFEEVDCDANDDYIGEYESFKATSGEENHPPWIQHLPWNDNDPHTRGMHIQTYLSWGCPTITKLEICIEFFDDNVLDRLSFPSLTSLAIVPHANIFFKIWSWRTVYLILKSCPNITHFRFEPLQQRRGNIYPFAETTDWKEYKRRIGHLPLPQLSSITAYRQLLKRLVPGRPVTFVKILLFPDVVAHDVNWPDPESDDEDGLPLAQDEFIVPYQLVKSATPIKTLYLQRIDEQEELDVIWGRNMGFLSDACPYLTDLWLPSLKITSKTLHYRDPADMVYVLWVLMVWDETLERYAVGPCSPGMAKELAWHREGTIKHERVHPTLKELLLGVDVLWKWQDDSEVTGWVLYISTDIEGSEDSEEGIHPPGSRYADSVYSETSETDSE